MLLLASSLGLYLRLVLSVVTHQVWLKNYSQYLIFSLLPITGYIITSVISTNIALSLGMVGALSIVRFRTPVKNPSELVAYFCLVTIGIVVNVDPNIALNFMIFVTLIVMATELFIYLSKRLKLNPFNIEENNLYYFSLSTNQRIDSIEESKFLFHKSYDENFMYQFKSNNIEDLEEIKRNVEESKIISYSFDAPTE
tara:strand:+ start:288 stop:878 length:591 start_codon:yes stop_codon:yes gene_type:complete